MTIQKTDSRKHTLIALLFVLVATLVCFHRLTAHPTHILVGPQNGGNNDLTAFFIPQRDYPWRTWRESGQLPTWNPHSLGGTPILGNPQAALFYPPNWLYLAFDAALAASWVLVFHHFWAACGTFLLCRRYGFVDAAAVTGAVVMLAAPFMLAQTGEGHYNQICVVAWIPWAFLAWERLRDRQPLRVTMMATILALCFFAGHAQELFYLCLTLSVFVLVDVVSHFRQGRRPAALHLVRDWCCVGLTTFGLIAIDLIPSIVYVFLGVRSGGIGVADNAGIDFINLGQLLNPWLLGGPETLADPPHFWETVCHFGVVPLLLMLASLALGRRLYPVRRMWLLWLTSLGFAFGAGSLIFVAFYWLVPGVSLFRAPARVFFLASFAAAVLSAAGVQAIATRLQALPAASLALQKRLALAFLLALGLTLFALVGGGSESIHQLAATDQSALALTIAANEVHAWSGVFARCSTWALLSLALLVCFVVARRPRQVRWTLFACAALCLLELSTFAHHVFRTVAPSGVRRENPIVDLLQDKVGLGRIVAQQQLLSDREAWQSGLYKVQAYEPVPLLRWVLAIDALTTQDPVAALLGYELYDMNAQRKTVVDLLGIRYAIIATTDPAEVPGWKLLGRGGITQEITLPGEDVKSTAYAVYENPSVLPRAFVVGQGRPLPDGPEMVELLGTIDPRQEVLLPTDVLPQGPRADFKPARIMEYSPHRVVIDADLNAPGYLFLSDLYYPGWTATDNESPAPIMPANLAFRAVPLSAGTHRVVLSYTPPGLKLGATFSLCTLLLLGQGLLRVRKRSAAAPRIATPE